MNGKSIPELSVDAQVLIAHMKQVPKGGLVTYAALNALISGNVQKRDRNVLQRARHRLVRDDKIVFETVVGEGVKRIEDADAIGIGTAAERRVRRMTRKAAEKMLCADYAALSNPHKVEYNTHLSILGALTAMTQTSKVKQIAAAVEAEHDKLALNKTLEAFLTGPDTT